VNLATWHLRRSEDDPESDSPRGRAIFSTAWFSTWPFVAGGIRNDSTPSIEEFVRPAGGRATKRASLDSLRLSACPAVLRRGIASAFASSRDVYAPCGTRRCNSCQTAGTTRPCARPFISADHLFKFHRRGFSWSSLERIDELRHMHRAPDLRALLVSLVTQLVRVLPSTHPERYFVSLFVFRLANMLPWAACSTPFVLLSPRRSSKVKEPSCRLRSSHTPHCEAQAPLCVIGTALYD